MVMEEVFITAIVFAFIFAAMKLFFDYLKTRRENSKKGSTGESLTESELRALVQEAVDGAMETHFRKLEKRLVERSEPKLIPAGERGGEPERPATPPVAGDRESTR